MCKLVVGQAAFIQKSNQSLFASRRFIYKTNQSESRVGVTGRLNGRGWQSRYDIIERNIGVDGRQTVTILRVTHSHRPCLFHDYHISKDAGWHLGYLLREAGMHIGYGEIATCNWLLALIMHQQFLKQNTHCYNTIIEIFQLGRFRRNRRTC